MKKQVNCLQTLRNKKYWPFIELKSGRNPTVVIISDVYSKYLLVLESFLQVCIFFFRTLRARGNVESWVASVEHAMFETVKM